jgi:hypothetical protein
MKRLLTLAIAALVYIAAITVFPYSSEAQQGGGFPSRPQFQAMRASSATGATCGNAGTAIVCGQSTATTPWSIAAATGALTGGAGGIYAAVGSASSDVALEICNGSAGSCWFKIDGVGNITNPVAPASTPWTSAISCAPNSACNVSGMKAGQEAYVMTTAAETRASTVSMTLDTVLNFTNVPAGTYVISGSFVYQNTTTTTQGYIGSFGSSTATISASYNLTGSIASSATPSTVTVLAGSGVNDINCMPTTPTTSAAWASNGAPLAGNGAGQVIASCTFTVSAAGTVGLYWAQDNSSANVSTMLAGSNLDLARVN